MARVHSTGTTASLWYGAWTQTAARVPGAGTGSATTAVGLARSADVDENGNTSREVFMGGEYTILNGIIQRTLRIPTVLKDVALAQKCCRGTSVQTALPFLTFAWATDVGPAKKYTDAWIKTAKFAVADPMALLTADYEVWALRETTQAYAVQTASTGAGPFQGRPHATTITVEGAATKLQSWEINLDNGFDWFVDGGVPAVGDEVEPDDFSEGEETLTASMSAYAPIADSVFLLGETTLVTDIDVVLTYTRAAKTVTFTLDEFFATQRAHKIPGTKDKYLYTVQIAGAKPQGSLVITST
jgi:hypothetical protein